MLPPETQKVWDFVRDRAELRGFVLIGGTALAMHIQHRLSEDLDFAHTAARLPRAQIDALLVAARGQGFVFERNDDIAAYEEFLIAGQDLHDYQQDFVVNGAVKVTFFSPDEGAMRVLEHRPDETLRVASIKELFALKCLVSASRSKTRDWFDLYVLLHDHGFTLRDFRDAFAASHSGLSAFENALSRLCSGIPQRGDEGFHHLAEKAPTLETMRDFFRAERDALERSLAAEARERQLRGEQS